MNASARIGRKRTGAKGRPGCLGILGLGIAALLGLAALGAIFGEEDAAETKEARSPSTIGTDTSKQSGGDSAHSDTVTLLSIIDGDTIETSAGTVRLLGIDTPERGECGYRDATLALTQLVETDETIELVLPAGQNDRDRHGRLIRYAVTLGGTDLGRAQLDTGHAVARYDSQDGYPAHPKENDYRAAQNARLGNDGSVITAACDSGPRPAQDTGRGGSGHADTGTDGPGPETATTEDATTGVAPPAGPSTETGVSSGEGDWFLQYPSCAALKRNTVGHPVGPLHRDDPAQAAAYNWFQYGTGHRGDGDGDGWACE